MPQSSSSRVSWPKRLGYGTGHVLNDMCAAMWFTYLLIFFHKVLSFSHLAAGALLTIGQFADGISTVFVGIFSDKGDNFWLCNRYGNRKSWHLVGTACVVFSFPFIFLPCQTCEDADPWALMIYYSAFVVIFQFGWASVQISHLSMIPDLTSCQNEYTFLTSIRYGATIAATLGVYAMMWGFLGIDKDNNDFTRKDANTFRNVAFISLGVGGLCSFIFHLIVKFESQVETDDVSNREIPNLDCDEEDHESILSIENCDENLDDNDVTVGPLQRNNHVENGGNPSLETQTSVKKFMKLLDWFLEPQLYQVALLYMCTRLFVNLSQSYMPMYLNVTLQLPQMYVAIIPSVMYVSGIFMAIIIKTVSKRLGKKFAYGISCLLGGSGCLWMHYGCQWNADYTEIEIYFVAALIGSGGAGILISSLSIVADLIGKNKESSAFVYGLMSLVDKVSNGIAYMIIQKYVPPHIDTCSKCRIYYEHVMVFICGGFALAGFLVALSLIPVVIGRRRGNTSRGEIMDDQQILPQNMETESMEES